MTKQSRFERFVEETFHVVILEFDPNVPETYRRCVKLLEELEQKIAHARLNRGAKRSLVARAWTQLAFMASEVGKHAEADRLTAEVLKLAASDDPNFALAALLRTQTLHSLGKHEEELADGLRYAESAAMDDSTLVYLLAELATRHPEMMRWNDVVVGRVAAYLEASPELAEYTQGVPSPEVDPMGYVLHVAKAIRKASRERTAHILAATEQEEE